MREQQTLYILASTEFLSVIVQAEGDLYEFVQYCLTRLVIEACGVRAYCIFPTGWGNLRHEVYHQPLAGAAASEDHELLEKETKRTPNAT